MMPLAIGKGTCRIDTVRGGAIIELQIVGADTHFREGVATRRTPAHPSRVGGGRRFKPKADAAGDLPG